MEFFERCGINPEQGRNSRILIVELSGIDSNRINASTVFNGLSAQLGMINPKKADEDTDKGGRWFISCLQLSAPELFKSGVSVVAHELFTRLLLGHWKSILFAAKILFSSDATGVSVLLKKSYHDYVFPMEK